MIDVNFEGVKFYGVSIKPEEHVDLLKRIANKRKVDLDESAIDKIITEACNRLFATSTSILMSDVVDHSILLLIKKVEEVSS